MPPALSSLSAEDAEAVTNRWWLRASVLSGDGRCWPWASSVTHENYGVLCIRLSSGDVRYPAHRVAWWVATGEDPPDVLDHTCHDPCSCDGGPTCPHRACVNPDHLTPSTLAENMRRQCSHNGRKDHCPAGHPYDETNTYYWNGHRRCRPCLARHQRASHERRRTRESADL